jgi:hypothetical protein
VDVVSYEALIAAQAKRLTKKRERNWRDDWRSDCRTYADLYVPPAPERVELSHTEWADGYKEWLAEQRAGIAALRADIAAAAMRRPCFAENEI